MKKFLLSFNLVILLSVFLTPLEALAGNKKGYALIQINIKNHELFFSTYGQKVPPIVAKYGGKALVATPAVDLKEGNWNHNWSVVLEFPSKKKALNWYHSKEYQKIVHLRRKAVDYSNIVIVEEFSAPTN